MSIQEQRRTPGLPCAMALRLIRDRPGDRLCLSPPKRHQQRGARPSRLHRTQSARSSSCCCVHRDLPLVCDDGQRPFGWDRMAGVIEMICPTGQQEYFYARGWTDFCSPEVICPSGCFVAGERSISSLRATRKQFRSPDFAALHPGYEALSRQFTALLTTTSISLAPGRLKADDSTDFNCVGSVTRVASRPSDLASAVKSTGGSLKSMPT